MNPVAKAIIAAGAVLIVIGLLWQLGGRYIPLGRLPGDIVVEKGGFRLYVPVVTCLLLSLAASLVMYLLRLLR